MSDSLKYPLIGVALAVVMEWGGMGGEFNFFRLVLEVVIFGAIGFGVAGHDMHRFERRHSAPEV